jgi:hypothetical protein
MKSIGKRALVLLGSSLFGATLWLASFIPMVGGSAHLANDIGPVYGVFVIGGGFIVAGTVGVAGAVYVLRRFWPRTISK